MNRRRLSSFILLGITVIIALVSFAVPVTAAPSLPTKDEGPACAVKYKITPHQNGGLGFNYNGEPPTPVIEVGPLAIYGQFIDRNTGQSVDLLNVICDHIRIVRGIATELRDKYLLLDPMARARAASEAHDEFVLVSEIINQSRVIDGKNTRSSFYPKNDFENKAASRREAAAVIDEDVLNSGNLHKDAIRVGLILDQNRNIKSELRSTMDQATYDMLMNNPEQLPGSISVYIKQVFEPWNNPIGSGLIASGLAQQRISEAENLMLLDQLAGGGILSSQKCTIVVQAGFGANNECRRWERIQPGSIINYTYAQALGYRLATANAQDNWAAEVGNEGNTPVDFINTVLEDSSQYTNVPPPSGGGVPGSGPGSGTDPVTVAFTPDPVKFDSYDPSNGEASFSLKWKSKNADVCVVRSNAGDRPWLSSRAAQDNANQIEVKGHLGEDVDRNGTMLINYPLNFKAFVFMQKPGTFWEHAAPGAAPYVQEGPNTSIFDRKTVLKMPEAGMIAGATKIGLAINIPPNGSYDLPITYYEPAYMAAATISGTDKASLVNALKTVIEGKQIGADKDLWAGYKFEYNTTDGTITISTETKYAIRCTRGAGTDANDFAEDEITITTP